MADGSCWQPWSDWGFSSPLAFVRDTKNTRAESRGVAGGSATPAFQRWGSVTREAARAAWLCAGSRPGCAGMQETPAGLPAVLWAPLACLGLPALPKMEPELWGHIQGQV